METGLRALAVAAVEQLELFQHYEELRPSDCGLEDGKVWPHPSPPTTAHTYPRTHAHLYSRILVFLARVEWW